MRLKVIFNPFADRGRAGARADALRAALRAEGLDYELIKTRGPGDARRAACSAANEDFDAIVTAGGDGTVNEVINGLMTEADERSPRPLGVLPLGTGNDFAEMIGLGRDLRQAVRVIASGRTRQIDIGRVSYWREAGAGPASVHYFGNNSAVAMEPLVTIENTRIRALSGNLRYIVALLRALRRLRAWQMRISWDDSSYEGPVYLLSVCNGRRCGGVFHMAPEARPDDGLLDLILIPELPKREVLTLLPRLLRGTHVNHPRAHYLRTNSVSISTTPATPIHADGEVLTDSAARIEYEVGQSMLTLFTQMSTACPASLST